MLNNIDNRFLVLAWLALCSSFIGVAGTLSGCTSTARASTVEIIDVSALEVVPSAQSEVISPPVEFHVTPTAFYMVETTGEHETYMVGDTRIDTEPGTLTLYN